MRKILPALSAIALVVCLTAFVPVNSWSANESKERIELVFTPDMSFEDLVAAKAAMSNKGISVKFSLIGFNDSGQLQQIKFAVDCHDGFSGAAGTLQLTREARLGFSRDYSSESSIPFAVGSLR